MGPWARSSPRSIRSSAKSLEPAKPGQTPDLDLSKLLQAIDDPRSVGAGNEARTRDLNLGKVALYQLSYSRPMQRRNCRAEPSGVKENPCAVASKAPHCPAIPAMRAAGRESSTRA